MTSSCTVENVLHGRGKRAERLEDYCRSPGDRGWEYGKVPGLYRNYKPSGPLLLYLNKLDVECKENVRVKDYLKVLDLTN